MPKVVWFLLAFFSARCTFGQAELILRKGYSTKVMERFKEGDSLMFSFEGSRDIYIGTIEILGDSTLFIADQTIPYHAITSIYLLRNSYGRQVFLKGLPTAAANSALFLFVYGNINAVVYGLWTTEYLKLSTLRSISILAGALTIHQIYNKTTHKKCNMDRYRLVKVNFP